MPIPEPLERRKHRDALRALMNHVARLDDPEHGFDSDQWKMHNIKILPMDLDRKSGNAPIFFTPSPTSVLLNPDADVGDRPFVGMTKHKYPEYLAMFAYHIKGPSYPHVKAVIYNNLNGADGRILRGEAMIALELSGAQLRLSSFMGHMIAPVLLFSFMGPQHARLIEAYFDGTSLVMRPTNLFDFRTKDEAVLKTFAQWHFGGPKGDTTALL
ncbi:uncharacterized protein TRUGW13939_03981 [Talaromyces rugulosus]|uniref:Uncharacterized protein n=1 Tax=Talaromyces rugulosus TaxID=121627 RepID=A0A7H8QSB7_TALRU|nr:uncharacterized protein TRUGW13939_03981 [Talaromyces rugulosus]QKX56874.1 hypothetical protein TRUGW13939_03981 [Talaromyces rugulosus]